MSKFDENTLKLLRHSLGSIDLSDIPQDEELSDAKVKEYNAAISAVFPRLEKDIKKFLHEQLLFISNEATSWEHVIFARGTYNGINLLLDHWRQAHTAHRERVKDVNEPDYDKNNPIGEIE